MPGVGNQRVQAIRALECPGGVRRSLDGMNVVMICANVIRIAGQHRFQDGDDLKRPLSRRPVRIPQTPRPQIHHALGVNRRRVGIIRVTLRKIAHGARIIVREFL